MDFEKIGRNIDVIRKQRGWTKEKLSQLVGTSATNVVNHIKTGRMSLEMLGRYADGMGCSIADLTDGVINPEDFHLETDLLSYYPYNLAAAVGFYNENLNTPEKRAEALETVYKIYIPAVLKSVGTLTEREQKVLHLRFENGLTYEQCGYQLKVTRERIRQVEAKALRKLRHPRHWKQWKMDTMKTAWDIAVERDNLKLEIINLQQELEKVVRATGYDDKRINQTLKDVEPPEDLSIDYLELSVRSWNCLHRAGFTKLSDFDGKTVADLMKVRNLGKKSMLEVLERLKEHGVILPDE